MQKKLYRSRKRLVGGVCSGIAEHVNVDPVLVRLIFIILLVFTGFAPGLIFYLLAWIIIPEQK